MKTINISKCELDIDKLMDNIAVQQADAYMNGAATNELILVMNSSTISFLESKMENDLTMKEIRPTSIERRFMNCRVTCDDSLGFGDVIIAR